MELNILTLSIDDRWDPEYDKHGEYRTFRSNDNRLKKPDLMCFCDPYQILDALSQNTDNIWEKITQKTYQKIFVLIDEHYDEAQYLGKQFSKGQFIYEGLGLALQSFPLEIQKKFYLIGISGGNNQQKFICSENIRNKYAISAYGYPYLIRGSDFITTHDPIMFKIDPYIEINKGNLISTANIFKQNGYLPSSDARKNVPYSDKSHKYATLVLESAKKYVPDIINHD